MEWPKPAEWGALAISLISLGVSLQGLFFNAETASAQRESLLIICKENGSTAQFLKSSDKRTDAMFNWVAQIYNTSATSLNIVSMKSRYHTDDAGDGENYSSREIPAGFFIKVDRGINDSGIFLEAAKSVNVGFTDGFPLGSGATTIPELKGTMSWYNIVSILEDHNAMDLLGSPSYHTKKLTSSSPRRQIFFSATTSRGSTFTQLCDLGDWGDVGN